MMGPPMKYDIAVLSVIESNFFACRCYIFYSTPIALKQELLIIYKWIMKEEVRVKIWLQFGIVNLN